MKKIKFSKKFWGAEEGYSFYIDLAGVVVWGPQRPCIDDWIFFSPKIMMCVANAATLLRLYSTTAISWRARKPFSTLVRARRVRQSTLNFKPAHYCVRAAFYPGVILTTIFWKDLFFHRYFDRIFFVLYILGWLQQHRASLFSDIMILPRQPLPYRSMSNEQPPQPPQKNLENLNFFRANFLNRRLWVPGTP